MSSGVRSYSFREGDRSEYLAQFLLSSIGLCTPIPRQEDIGYDFACSIADQENGLLTFGFPYLISIKSSSTPSIEVKPNKSNIEENNTNHVEWLFKQEQPILLGVVDKKAVTLRIYSLLPVWFLYYSGRPRIGTLSLTPRLGQDEEGDVGIPVQHDEMSDWPGHFHFDADLGHPIAILNMSTLQDEDATRNVKMRLRQAVDLAARNILHYRLGIPHFYWFPKTTVDASFSQAGFSYHPVPPVEQARSSIMTSLAPSLISFALHFKEVGDASSLDACKTLLSHAPVGTIPEVVLDHVPELRR